MGNLLEDGFGVQPTKSVSALEAIVPDAPSPLKTTSRRRHADAPFNWSATGVGKTGGPGGDRGPIGDTVPTGLIWIRNRRSSRKRRSDGVPPHNIQALRHISRGAFIHKQRAIHIHIGIPQDAALQRLHGSGSAKVSAIDTRNAAVVCALKAMLAWAIHLRPRTHL